MKKIRLLQVLFFILAIVFLVLSGFFNLYPSKYIWNYGALPEALIFIAIFSFPFVIFTYTMMRLNIKSKTWKFIASGISVLAAIAWSIVVTYYMAFACFDACPRYVGLVYTFGYSSIAAYIISTLFGLRMLFKKNS